MTEKQLAADGRSSMCTAYELRAMLDQCASLIYFLVKEAESLELRASAANLFSVTPLLIDHLYLNQSFEPW